MRTTLIGHPFSGKSTVFQALTGLASSKKEETIGTIKVPDKRIDFLASVYQPKKSTYAEFILSDINVATTKNDLISPKAKNIMQKADMLILVLRNFDSILTDKKTNPLEEYEQIRDELIFNDLAIIEKRLEREKKEHKNPPEIGILKKLYSALEQNQLPQETALSSEEHDLISNYGFLTLKKKIALVNQKEGDTEVPATLQKAFGENGIPFFFIMGLLECELGELPEEEKGSFLESYGLKETAKDKFIHEAYESLGLISFLTAGKDECRAWPIRQGTSAVVAAGKIHSDIARGFIRAETIAFDDFKQFPNEAECKKKGLYRLEGKDYIVADGDIINFRFNV